MRCEVIAVGTELLLGQIVDTNSSWMGEHLALAGIDSHFQTKLGLERSDAVILCGGLGPTQDDITREAIAEVMGVPLVRDTGIGERIRALFASRGRKMTDNNLRQADVPEGASVIPQMPGTAPGLVCPVGDKIVYAVPGVPHEMREMLNGTVIPDLQKRAGLSAVIRSRVLRTWGQTESGLAEMLAGRIEELDAPGNPTLAFQASGIEGIKVRITAKAGSAEEAETILSGEEARLRAILGDAIFGIDNGGSTPAGNSRRRDIRY
jgi:nicotinamide-nucleotide amidase